jgi:hypothetical protein
LWFFKKIHCFSHFETDKQEEGRIKRKKNKFKK